MAKRTSAFIRATEEAGRTMPTNTEEIELDSNTVSPLSSPTVEQIHSETVAKLEDSQVIKTSFYPRQDQLDKLDDLATEYNKRYRRQRKKIDRQDIIRYLIDKCDLDTLTDLQI